MYLLTGSNLFGQWIPFGQNIIHQFSRLPCKKITELNSDFKANDAFLTYVGWSHNIFKVNNEYYILGDYKCTGIYVEHIKIPEECGSVSNVTVLSNDYYLFVFNRDACEYWIVNLENNNVKKINLAVEVSLKTDPKRIKSSKYISKCVVFNKSLIFLTSSSTVYYGMMPNIVDTSHCKGEPKDIKCGNEHYMLLTSSGAVYTWGNGRRLQLGHGDINSLDVPAEVEALAGIKIIKIAAGGWHSLALSEFGDLYAWGWNDAGQLGLKENAKNKYELASYSLPTLVDIFDENGDTFEVNVKEIACGTKHSAILLADNSVWASGDNKYGQLGHSNHTFATVKHFKKCCSFASARDLICGQWSTAINVIESYLSFMI